MADEGAADREEGFVDVGASVVATVQAAVAGAARRSCARLPSDLCPGPTREGSCVWRSGA